MAPQSSDPKVPKETLDGLDSGGSGEELKSNAQDALKLSEYLRRYTPSTPETKRDMLGDRYRIELSTPLPEFDSKMAQAYAATDLTEPLKPIYAHVCYAGSMQRHRALQLLQPTTHQYILQTLAAGPVELSRPEEERFVIFYERPAGQKLSQYLVENKGQITQQFLCDRVIAPLASAINQFAELDIAHGLINLENIYFSDIAVLGPCVSEPCGYSQSFQFEPLERLQSLPAGKGEGSTAQDYYALAVVALHIIHGAEHFAGLTPELLCRMILREGAYNALTRQKNVPEMFHDFFRGMLCQNASERWDYHYVKPWLEGKRYNVLMPPTPTEAIRPFEYGATQANNRREAAHIFATDWDNMTAPLQNGQLTHWVSVSLRNKDLSEGVARVSRTVTELGLKNDLQLTEQLMRVILLLDPQGPIRIKQLAFHIDGIDTLCAHLYASKSQQELQFLAKFIEFNMGNYWLELQRKGREYALPTAVNNIFIKLDRLRTYIRNTGYGFGLERMLYDLNPDLPCLSPMFETYNVNSLQALLKRMDKLARAKAKDEDPIDRHIAAYIASKLNIQHEIRLHDLAAVPAMATHRTVIALYLLSQAQQKVGNIQLPGLTHWVSLRILPALDAIHSRTLRHKLRSLLMDQALTGYTQLLAELIINVNYAGADQAGFHQAWLLYQTNAAKIESYRKGHNIDKQSARIGFAIAKIFAYLALMVSAICVFKGS